MSAVQGLKDENDLLPPCSLVRLYKTEDVKYATIWISVFYIFF